MIDWFETGCWLGILQVSCLFILSARSCLSQCHQTAVCECVCLSCMCTYVFVCFLCFFDLVWLFGFYFYFCFYFVFLLLLFLFCFFSAYLTMIARSCLSESCQSAVCVWVCHACARMYLFVCFCSCFCFWFWF